MSTQHCTECGKPFLVYAGEPSLCPSCMAAKLKSGVRIKIVADGVNGEDYVISKPDADA